MAKAFNFDELIKSGVNQAMEECELTIGMTLKEAVEKQIPKKANISIKGTTDYNTSVHCPTCHKMLTGIKPHYCSECGQALDWGE